MKPTPDPFTQTIRSTLLLALTLLLAACQNSASPTTPVPTASATIQATIAPTPTPSVTVPLAPTSQPTVQPSTTPPATATPHPLHPYTIEGLRQRDFPGGQIVVRHEMQRTEVFTQYAIAYPSEGLTISGLLYQPHGDGPFPVLILLHGYIDRDAYFPGADTWQAAEFFVRQGYLVLSPDLRSWGDSDTGLNLFHSGLVADVLNLISSLPTLPQADPARLGLWGHSMGGGIATKVLAVDDGPRAAVLYAPNSADDADLIARWGPGCLPGQSQAAGDHCNPADVIPPDTPPAVIDAYINAAGQPAFLQQTSPLYHLDNISAPIQIHIGTADGQALVETPTEWSAKLAQALQAANRDVTYYSYPGQGHAFTGEAWTTLLNRSLDFFDVHLNFSP